MAARAARRDQRTRKRPGRGAPASRGEGRRVHGAVTALAAPPATRTQARPPLLPLPGRGGAREGGAAGSLITVPGEGEPVPAEQHAGRGTEPRRRPAAQRADEAAAGAEAGAGVHRAVHEQARHLRGG